MVQKAEEREHSLFNRVRNAEYARQKQEQKVKKIQSKLHEVRFYVSWCFCCPQQAEPQYRPLCIKEHKIIQHQNSSYYNLTLTFDLWPWPTIQPSQGRAQPSCQKSRSRVKDQTVQTDTCKQTNKLSPSFAADNHCIWIVWFSVSRLNV